MVSGGKALCLSLAAPRNIRASALVSFHFYQVDAPPPNFIHDHGFQQILGGVSVLASTESRITTIYFYAKRYPPGLLAH